MTLIETLIACAATAMLFALIAQILVPVFQAVSRQSVQTTMSQQAVVALNRLEWDLRHTSRYGVSVLVPAVASDPVAIGINRFRGDIFVGQPSWEAAIVAYVWLPRERRLIRRTSPPVLCSVTAQLDPLAPTACTPSQLADIAAASSPQDVVLAASVSGFTVTVDAAYKVTLSLEEKAGHDEEPRRVELSRSFMLRNHL